MQVTVVGAGIAGLAITWHLIQLGIEVILYDGGAGASHVSTGLLYPFPGRMAAKCWQAREGMAASLELIDAAEQALGMPVADRSGILRLPWAEWQKRAFLKRCQKEPEAEWRDGMWIASGMTVFAKRYLEGLKKACAKATIIEGRVESFDGLTILATGAETLKFVDLPLVQVKGQALLCRWKEPLPYALVGNGHITRTEHPDLCLVGSTYEHQFETPGPEKKVIPELIEKAAAFYPQAREFEVLDIQAGLRMARIDQSPRPIVQKIDEKTWVFTALSSRGLLYHALLAKNLAQEIKLLE